MWTYSIRLCGTASNSNQEILQRYQNVVLRVRLSTAEITGAAWYVTNQKLQRDIQMASIKEEILKNFQIYMDNVQKQLARELLYGTSETGRVKR